MHRRCHVLPWLIEFSGVVLNCFTISRWTLFYGSITHTTGILAHTTIQGNCVGQENWLQPVTALSVHQGQIKQSLDGDKIASRRSGRIQSHRAVQLRITSHKRNQPVSNGFSSIQKQKQGNEKLLYACDL